METVIASIDFFHHLFSSNSSHLGEYLTQLVMVFCKQRQQIDSYSHTKCCDFVVRNLFFHQVYDIVLHFEQIHFSNYYYLLQWNFSNSLSSYLYDFKLGLLTDYEVYQVFQKDILMIICYRDLKIILAK
jgi:hypothetical protein